jgi:hypothetical protein
VCFNTKTERKRRSFGLCASVYPCGFIDNIQMMQSSESLTLISIIVADSVHKNSNLRFIGYDFACGLYRHINGLRAISGEFEENIQRIKSLTFVVDKFHSRTHSCLKKKDCTHRWESYDELKSENSQICEQTFKFFRKLYSNLSSCSIRTCFLIYLTIIFHRNLQMEQKKNATQLQANLSKYKRKRKT